MGRVTAQNLQLAPVSCISEADLTTTSGSGFARHERSRLRVQHQIQSLLEIDVHRLNIKGACVGQDMQLWCRDRIRDLISLATFRWNDH